MGYAIAHPRLNPVGILPPGSRPSDVHFNVGIIAVVDAMTCEACEAETQARHIARGKRSATPGYHHPPYGRMQYAHTYAAVGIDYDPSGDEAILTAERLQLQ